MNKSHCRILIAHLIFIIVGIQISPSTAKSLDDGIGIVCQTPLCKELSNTFISSMNQYVDPCDDFFEYTCGNFSKETQSRSTIIPNIFTSLRNRTDHRIREILESPSLPHENIALTKSKKLYEACMNTNAIESHGLKTLSELMDKIGGWPMTLSYNVWRSQQKSWNEIDLIIRKTLGDGPFFTMSVISDLTNSSTNLQWLTVPNAFNEAKMVEYASLPSHLSIFDNSPNNLLYRGAIVDSAKLIASYKKSRVSDRHITLDATNIMIFELELKIIISNMHNQGVGGSYQKISISELQKLVDKKMWRKLNGKIDWLSYLRDLYSDIPNTLIDDSEEIVVVTTDYFEQLFDLLDKTPSRIIVNTMHWWLLKELAFFTNSKLKNIIMDSNYRLSLPQWRFCINHNEMVHAIASAYVKKYFSKQSKPYILDMVSEIIAGMRNDIDHSKWLDYYSKNGALKKLAFMREFVGFPDWYDSDKAIAAHYEDLNVGPIFIENSIAVLKFNFKQELKSLRQRVDKNKWTGSPTVVNAYYYYPGNSLTLPAGILQVPFFNEKQPDALNYGAIGSFIGHEISHAFDAVGSEYDENGNVRNWWTSRTKSEYLNRAQCFIDQFSKYKIEFNSTSYQIDAVQTLSENIADTTGINALFEAFTIHLKKHPAQANVKLPGLEHLNSKQLLFLSWAHSFCESPKLADLVKFLQRDSHSPGKFRIIGTLSNLNSFSDTYQCAKGTAMNPVKKCGIW